MNKKYIVKVALFISCINTTHKIFSAAAATSINLESKSSAESLQQVQQRICIACAADGSHAVYKDNLLQPIAFKPEILSSARLFAELLKSERVEEHSSKREIMNALIQSRPDKFQRFSLPEIHDMLQYAKNNQFDIYCASKTIPELCKVIQVANYIDGKELFDKTAQKIAKQFIALGSIGDPRSIRAYIDSLPDDIQCVISAEIMALSPSHFFSSPDFMQKRVNANYAAIAMDKHKVFNGHRDVINSVSWNHDNSKIATASADNRIHIWDVATGSCMHILRGHTAEVASVSWSPAGDKLASASYDHTVRIWDVATGAEEKTFEGHADYVSSVSWSPTEDKLASGSSDGTVRIWNVSTQVCEQTLIGHHWNHTCSVSWNHNGTLLATASCDNEVSIWDTTTGNFIGFLGKHVSTIESVAWNPAGTKLATASPDGIICIWDAVTRNCELTFSDHCHAIASLSWNPTGDKLASASLDNTVRIWDIATATCEKLFEHTGLVLSAAWSHDGTRLASASSDAKVRIFDISSINEEIKKINTMTFAELLALDGQAGKFYRACLAEEQKYAWTTKPLLAVGIALTAFVYYDLAVAFVEKLRSS